MYIHTTIILGSGITMEMQKKHKNMCISGQSLLQEQHLSQEANDQVLSYLAKIITTVIHTFSLMHTLIMFSHYCYEGT